MKPTRCAIILAYLGSVSFVQAQSGTASGAPGAIEQLLPVVEDYIALAMQKTGVPGVAVGIVYQDKVAYPRGFGVRKAGTSIPVDADTVFQLASVSKPIASTVVAAVVSRGDVSWDDKIVNLDPDFKLSDPSVTEQVTIRDFLSHRSGLPNSAGDVPEDLGFSRPEILHQMRLLPLTGEFRKSYNYSNFPFTEGAIAAAKKVNQPWESLAEDLLFRPLGMTSTSYRWSARITALYGCGSHPMAHFTRCGTGTPITFSIDIKERPTEPLGALSSHLAISLKYWWKTWR